MVARSMRFTAQPGRADELADLLLQVAEALRATEGCLSWLVARNPESADEVWVQELWSSEEAADHAVQAQGDTGPKPADVMALCASQPERTDLRVAGGVGYVDPA